MNESEQDRVECSELNQTNDILILLLAFDEGWAVVVFVGIGNGVDREAGAVRSGVWGYVS